MFGASGEFGVAEGGGLMTPGAQAHQTRQALRAGGVVVVPSLVRFQPHHRS